MAKNTKPELTELPLLDAIEENGSSLLVQPVLFDFDNYEYIWSNLKHRLRNYQINALQNFHYALNYKNWDWNFDESAEPDADLLNIRQFMFWMATGSGKTDVMAALILYLYKERGFQNFVFTTTLTSVLEKTKDNLGNQTSDKYLFKQSVWIEGKRVKVRLVRTVPEAPEPNTINILIANVSKIANALKPENIRESIGDVQLSPSDFQDKKFVVLADEAHHFNAETKGEGGAYERALNRIRSMAREAIQLEFTATLNGMDGQSEIYNKYKNKIVYRFDLGVFSKEKYSKQITQISSNADDDLKMMQAIFMNVARQQIALQNGIEDYKPIILFKTNTKLRNNNTHKLFRNLVSELTVESLESYLTRVSDNLANVGITNSAMEIVRRIPVLELLRQIKSQFSDLNVGNVNDEKSEFIKWLNNLESPDSPYRVVFAVEKLTEGWDVLNLYDIVRLDDSKLTKNATNSEAQLVGRGARYFPLHRARNNEITEKRIFDDAPLELQLLEMLLFHTIREDKYIEQLKVAYNEMGLNVAVDQDSSIELGANVKKMVKALPIWKNGVVFENNVRPTTDSDYTSLADYGISDEFTYNLSKSAVGDLLFVDEENSVSNTIKRDFKVDKKALIYAARRMPFFRFNTLAKFIPNLKSSCQFTDEYLKDISVEVVVDLSHDPSLTAAEILAISAAYLEQVEKKIKKNYKKEVGINEFTPRTFDSVFSDYSRRFPLPKKSTDPKYTKRQRVGSWFAFDASIGDEKEQALVDLIEQNQEQIQQAIGIENKFLLLRNDESAHGLAIHEINGMRRYLPDYVLAVEGKNQMLVQLYLEPKGENIADADKWKEDLLLSLSEEAVISGYAGKAKLIGLPFYTNATKKHFADDIVHTLKSVFEGE